MHYSNKEHNSKHIKNDCTPKFSATHHPPTHLSVCFLTTCAHFAAFYVCDTDSADIQKSDDVANYIKKHDCTQILHYKKRCEMY